MRGEEQVATILRYMGPEAPVRMVRPLMDQHILRLRRADAMVIDLLVEGQAMELAGIFFRLVVAAVEKPFAVQCPGGGAVFDPFYFIIQRLSGCQVQDPPRLPVRAGLGHAVGQVFPVVTDSHAGQGHGAVLRPGVRIEHDARLALQSIGHIEHGLVLQTVVLAEVVFAGHFVRRGVALVIP